VAVLTPPETPPRRGRFRWLPTLLAGTCLLAGFGFASYRVVGELTKPSAATLASRAAKDAATREALSPHVQYAITGTAKQASVVVVTPNGPQNLEHVAVPLVTKTGLPYLEFTVKHGDPVGISVRAEDGGSITCTITVGSKVVVTQTAPGPTSPAVCEGAVP
jgi:hypothetical protein